MRIILAELGNDFNLDNAEIFSGSNSNNELSHLKVEIEKRVNIKSADQILITATGVQLKESDNKIINSSKTTTIVVFNRRLLQDHACVQRLINSIPQVTENLIESKTIPNLKELETMIYLYEAEERDQELYNTLDHIIQESIIKKIVCVQSSKRRYAVIDQFVREFNGQAIAINAALNNLESHVRTAHQNIGKFDRIAQREFSKHAIAIANIDLDIKLLQTIQLHPRVCHISNSMQLDQQNTTLGTFVPIKELEKSKQIILLKYDELVSATLEQKNKVAYLHQQTSNVSTQRTTSDIVIERVQKLKEEVYRFTTSVLEIQKKIYDELKRRKKQKKIDSLQHLDINAAASTPPPPPPPSPPRSSSVTEGMDGSSTSTIQYYPLSPPTKHQSNSKKKKTQNILRDAVRSLYLHETFIHQAEKSVIEEKQTSLTSFIHCMQSISKVEESVTKIYPRLADLEKDIKLLRHEIEKGKGATAAKRVIAGYGMLLIELWRRDKYTEIVKGNAHLLQNLFGEFGQLEKSYRSNFEKEIVCLDKNHILTLEEKNGKQQLQAILPFQMQNIDDPPVICSTSTTNPSPSSAEAYDGDHVTRKEVEEYIQMVHSYYASNNMPANNKNNEKKSSSRFTTTKKDEMSRDVSFILSQNLEREAKRIRSGLAQLGLPGTRQDGNNSNNMPASLIIETSASSKKDLPGPATSSTSSSSIISSITSPISSNITSAISSRYYTPDMKLASPSPVSHISDHHLSSMPSTAALFQQQKDWELEKASILRQSQEYRKYIEDLHIKYEQDKSKFEKDKQSLLRKLYTQEARIEEIKGNFNNQIQNYQIQIANAETNHKNKEKEWQQKYESTLQTEQEKYDRRLNGFHQRMNAKDEAYAKLEETYLRETKSAPTSPTSSTFVPVRRFQSNNKNHHQQKSNNTLVNAISQEEYDCDIAKLQQKISDLVTSHQEEIAKLQKRNQHELDQLRIKLQEEHRTQPKPQQADKDTLTKSKQHKEGRNQEELLAIVASLESEKKTNIDKLAHFAALKEQMDFDRTREINMYEQVIDGLKKEIGELKDKHQSKILQMSEKFTSNEARLKSLFMNENQQITMHCEARIENLVAEHQNNMQELKDTLENEKEVLQIKHQTAFDEKCREFESEMSEWIKKRDSLNHENKVLAQVVNHTKDQKEKIRLEFAKFKKDSDLKSKELINLQQEQRAAKRIARDALSLSFDYGHSENIDPNAKLLDMLSKTLSNITSLKTRSNIMEQTMESPSYMMNMFSYGF